MGSSNRDYMQDDYETRGPSWGHDVPTTKWLIIVTVGAFFLQTVMTHPAVEVGGAVIAGVEATTNPSIHLTAFRGPPMLSYIVEWFALDMGKVLHGQVWRLVTYAFCHGGNPFSLVFNMVALWFLGSTLERMYGSRELLWFYLTSALVSGLVFTAFGLMVFLPYPFMGANPCIMALLTLFATHFPRQEILFCWVIPVQIRVLLLIYIAVDLYGIVEAYSGQAPWAKVAYASEIWCVPFGYLYRRYNWRLAGLADIFDLRKLPRTMRRANTSRRLKVFQPESTTNLDEQVDAILAKIHEHGSESLTDRERAILQRASEQAKDRL